MKSKYYLTNKLIYDSYKTKCCICGESAKCCLEFHHIKDKNFNISKSLKYITPLLLLNELNLTICICKNCHSKLHNGMINYERDERTI